MIRWKWDGWLGNFLPHAPLKQIPKAKVAEIQPQSSPTQLYPKDASAYSTFFALCSLGA